MRTVMPGGAGYVVVDIPDPAGTIAPAQSSTLPINVVTYGADPSGVADSTAAINAAIQDASKVLSGQGVVFFPAGTYSCSGTINMKSGVVLTGQALTKAIIKYTGTTGQLLVFSHVNSAAVNNIELRYTNPAYSDVLVACPLSSEICFDRVVFRGYSTVTLTGAAALLDTTNAIEIYVSRCHFWGAQIGGRGVNPATGGFNNVIEYTKCVFNYCEVYSLYNHGLNFKADTCTFEPTTAGKASGIGQPFNSWIRGCTIINCYFSDASVAGNNWADLFVFGGTISGCYVNCCATTTPPTTLIAQWNFVAGTSGVVFEGNYLLGQINFAGGCNGFKFNGNKFVTFDGSPVSLASIFTNLQNLYYSDFAGNTNLVDAQTVTANASSLTVAPNLGRTVYIDLQSGVNVTSLTISAGWAGQRLELVFVQPSAGTPAAVPATWGNTSLAGGSFANTLTLGKRDVVTVEYDGAAARWYEVGRSLNLTS